MSGGARDGQQEPIVIVGQIEYDDEVWEGWLIDLGNWEPPEDCPLTDGLWVEVTIRPYTFQP